MIDRLKSYLWSKAVDISFKIATKDTQVAFEHRDQVILAMDTPSRQQFYARCNEAADGGAVQAELEAVLQTLYTEAALGDISEAERTSKRFVIVCIGQFLKRLHALGARSKAPSSDAPLNQQMR